MLEKAKLKSNDNLFFTQADATATGFSDSVFDFSTTGFSLHEVEEPVSNGFLREMIRVTKPCGALIFTDFSVPTANGFKNAMRQGLAHSAEWFAGGEHYRNYTAWMARGGLAGFLDRNGLAMNQTIPLNGGHILIARVVHFK